MEKLLEIIDAEGIYFDFADLQAFGDIEGLYVDHPRAGPIILLDNLLLFRPREQRCVTAHEIGHHFSPPRVGLIAFHKRNLYADNRNEIITHQDERKALRHATDLLMPTIDTWRAIRTGYDTIPLLADYFYVTEWFVRAKIGFICVEEREQGMKLRRRDIIRKTPMVEESKDIMVG